VPILVTFSTEICRNTYNTVFNINNNNNNNDPRGPAVQFESAIFLCDSKLQWEFFPFFLARIIY